MERNDKHRLDRLLREKLDAPQHPQDAGLWNDIERELDKRKRRGFFMRKRNLLSLLVLLIGGATVFTVYQWNNAMQVQREEKSITNPNISTQNSNLHQGVSSSQTQIESNNTAKDNTTLVSKAHTTEINAGEGHANVVRNNLASQQETIAKIDNLVFNVDQLKAQPTEVFSVGVESYVIAPELNSTNDNPDVNVAVEDAIIQQQPAVEANNDLVTNENITDTVAQEFHQVVSGDTTSIASLPSETADAAEKHAGNPFVQKRFTWSIALQAQLNFVSKQINADDFSQMYLQRRNKEEQSTHAFSYGLRGGVEYKRFVLQSGVTMRTYAEDIFYENRSQRYLVKTISYVQDSMLYDTTTVSEVNNKLDQYNGRHANRYLEIPLLIGYRIGNSNFSVTPSVGVSFAKPLRWSSRYLNNEANDLVDPEAAYGLTPFVKSFASELTVSMLLSNHVFLDASAAYNRNMQSVFKNSSGLDQRYQNIGGGVALRYRF